MLEITKNIIGGAAALSVLVVACTTTTTDNSSSSSGGTSSGSSGSAKDGGSSGSSGDETPSKDAGGGGNDKCAEEKTILDCAECCGGLESLIPYNQAYLGCACEAPCKDECATTLCGETPQDPDAACEQCLDADATVDKCDPPAQAECDKDKACSDFTVCTLAAKCLQKPQQ